MAMLHWRAFVLALILLAQQCNGVPKVDESSPRKNKETSEIYTTATPAATDSGVSSSAADKSSQSASSLSLHAIHLTSKNFAESVGDGNVWLIEFYTPW